MIDDISKQHFKMGLKENSHEKIISTFAAPFPSISTVSSLMDGSISPSLTAAASSSPSSGIKTASEGFSSANLVREVVVVRLGTNAAGENASADCKCDDASAATAITLRMQLFLEDMVLGIVVL
jgi:hypothetical protein